MPIFRVMASELQRTERFRSMAGVLDGMAVMLLGEKLNQSHMLPSLSYLFEFYGKRNVTGMRFHLGKAPTQMSFAYGNRISDWEFEHFLCCSQAGQDSQDQRSVQGLCRRLRWIQNLQAKGVSTILPYESWDFPPVVWNLRPL